MKLYDRVREEETHMADTPSDPDSTSDAGVGSDREYPGTPRWVKALGIIVVVVLLVVIVMVLGGHTPRVHHGP